MRLVRYLHHGEALSGIVVGDAVHAVSGVSLTDLVASGVITAKDTYAQGRPESVALDAVELLAPLPVPPSIRDFMAFEQHVEGMGLLVGADPLVPDVWYEQPLYYFTNPTAVVGPYDDVAMPPGCRAFDFEVEVAAVIGPLASGQALTDLTVDQAAECIVGYTLFNDWSARDLQMREMQGPLGPCKGKDSAITLGPWLLTADELPGLATGSSDVVLSVEVGDRYSGHDRLDSMSWTFAELVAYASRGTRLQPGDIFGSGTCGNGCLAERWGRSGRDNAPPLAVGEVVRITAGPLGEIANRIVDGVEISEPLRRRQPRT
jgi:2-keto-4-pentenoate hydratase/2-oxohepta-3-ene-1,7-dioic acid hydratase in catechol pathway